MNVDSVLAMRLLPRLLLSGVLISGLASCSSSAPTTQPGTTQLLTNTTATTGAPTTAPPTTALATTGADSSEAAAAELVDAWNAKDKKRAATVADTDAVNGMFAVPDPSAWFRGCSLDANEFGEGRCIYRTESGAITIDTERRGDRWAVINADWQADDELVTKGPDTTLGPTTLPPTSAP